VCAGNPNFDLAGIDVLVSIFVDTSNQSTDRALLNPSEAKPPATTPAWVVLLVSLGMG
jgi:hypothetical protein